MGEKTAITQGDGKPDMQQARLRGVRVSRVILSVLLTIVFCVYPLVNDHAAAATLLKCAKCGKLITGKYVSAEGLDFHPGCFACDICNRPLSGSYVHKDGGFFHPECFRFSKGLVCDYCGQVFHDDRWTVYQGKKYHDSCFEEHIRPRCGICRKKIYDRYITDEAGVYHLGCYLAHKQPKCSVCLAPIEGDFIEDPWGNRAHATHDHAPTLTCDSCSRIISPDTSKGGYRYADGRYVCGICRETAVDTPADLEKSMRHVMALFSENQIKDIPDNIPVTLMDLDQLRTVAQSDPMSRIRGYTLLAVLRKNGDVYRSHRIFILHGLPQLEFEGVLAHELLHVWLQENQVKMSRDTAEGFCNLGTMVVYLDNGSQFAGLLLENMKNNPDPSYGGAFREMQLSLEHLGWTGLLQMLRKEP